MSEIRALMWKEWREQRPLLLAMMGLGVLLPLLVIVGYGGFVDTSEPGIIATVVPAIFAITLLPFYAAATGASTVANELSENTLGFLLSRPVSRVRVWMVKVAVGLFGIVALLGWLLLLAWLVGRWAGHPDALRSTMNRVDGKIWQRIASAGSFTMLLFATSVFFSTFVPRALSAAAAGLAASVAILAIEIALWSAIDIHPRFEARWLLIESTFASGVALLASLFIFSRGELLRGAGVRRAKWTGAAILIVAVGAAFGPMSVAATRPDADSANIDWVARQHGGAFSVVTAFSNDYGGPEVWLLPHDGRPVRRLGPRLSYRPVVSPDGKWVAYLSQSGRWGLPSRSVDLRAVLTDGSSDHLVLPGLDTTTKAQQTSYSFSMFSPDGRHLAIHAAGLVWVADVLEGGARQVDLTCDESARRPGDLWGFSPDGTELLFRCPRGGQGQGVSVMAVRWKGGGARRVLYRVQGSYVYVGRSWLYNARVNRRLLPLYVGEGSEPDRRRRLVVVDLNTGSTQTITERACSTEAEVTADLRSIVYCERLVGGRWQLRRRELETGVDRALADFAGGNVQQLVMGPSGDFVVLSKTSPAAPIPKGHGLREITLVGRNGTVREIAGDWAVEGWVGDDRFVLTNYRSPGGRMALGYTDGRPPTVFFP